MFWRKKSDGFEWHRYVRTTIKLKREDRRRRIDDAKNAAIDGLRDAGRAGLAAGSAGIEHAWSAAQVGARAGAAGARSGIAAGAAGARSAIAAGVAGAGAGFAAAMAGAQVGLRLAWAAARTGASALLAGLARAATYSAWLARAGLSQLAAFLRPRCDGLMLPGVQPILLSLAALAGLSGLITVSAAGLTTAAVLFLAVTLTALLAAALPVILDLQGLPRPVALALAGIVDAYETAPPRVRKSLAAAAAAVVAVGAAWVLVRSAPQLPSLPSLGVLTATVVEGRGTAISGDVLRVRDVVVRLSGVEAPLLSQRCSRPGNRRWRCGEASQEALARALRTGIVRCELSGSDEAGRAFGTCTLRGKDLAAALVREGALFSAGGLLSSYDSEEKQAMAERAGLWQGEVERPSEYRAKLWEAAKRAAPDECPIKGQVSSGGRYYLVPWSPNYTRAQVRVHRGERWFCSESEAVAAGWKPLERG